MKLSMKVKFVLVATVISAISICIISAYMTTRFTALYGEQTAISNKQILNQLSYNLNSYLDEIYRLTIIPYYNRDVMNELRLGPPATMAGRLSKSNLIESFLSGTMVYPRKDIHRVSIIADNSYFSDRSGPSLPTYEEMKASQWYREVLQQRQAMVVLPGTGELYFSVVNVINDLLDNSLTLGVIKVDANYNTIRQLCENVDMGSNGGVVILTEGGEVVYSSMDSDQTSFLLEDMTQYPEVDFGQLHSQRYLCNSVTLSRFGWRVITANSIDSLKSAYNSTRMLVLLVASGGMVVASALMYLLMRYFFSPFYSVIALMQTVECGDFSVRYTQNSQDEVGYLGRALNNMLDRIDEMFRKNAELDKRIYQASLFQRETQIQLLYSQIRPHFMYNTLNMISILIQQDQPEQAVDNINRLSLILRGIAYINKEIPLETELRLVESYLSIQHNRYGDKLSYKIAVPTELQGYILPALILQPIVENAVIHNSESSRKQLFIHISGEETADAVILRIADNGNGISPQGLERLNRLMQRKYPVNDRLSTDLSVASGMGLANVNMRLRIRFGPEYGLRVSSGQGDGTTVAFVLPREEEAYDSRSDR